MVSPLLPAWTGTVLAIIASDEAGPSNHTQQDMETTHGVRTEPLHDGTRDPGLGFGRLRSHGGLGHGSAQADPGPGGPAEQREHPGQDRSGPDEHAGDPARRPGEPGGHP